MKTRLFRIPLWIIFCIAIALFLFLVVIPVFYILYWPLGSPPLGQEVDFKIKFGASPESIATTLEKQGVVRSSGQFLRAVTLLHKSGSLRAGRFRLPYPISNYRAIKLICEGPQVYTKITIPEGISARKMAQLFHQHMQMDSSKFMRLVSDSALIARMGLSTATLEGYLLPETYHFPYGISEAQVIAQLVGQFKRSVWDSLHIRSQEMGFTIHELVTLASIIQAEAVLDSELTTISSVYHNRLRLGVPLQADPTIQYIVPDGPRRLLNRDLEIESPYNTYLHKGLPPGPINNPGKTAVMAALHPQATNFLYFVATGKGGHTFTANFRQHLIAKSIFDQERRRVAQQNRRIKSGQN